MQAQELGVLLSGGAGRDCPSLSVVVPVYNSSAGLEHLIDRLGPILASAALNYELILVNDGSPDDSWSVIRMLQERHAWVRGISLMRNYGQHAALLCGIRAARGTVLVTLDDDLQNPPEEIPKLLNKLSEGHDVVYGTPQQEQHGFIRDVASRLIKVGLSRAMGAEAARSVSAFRAFRSEVRAAFRHYDGPAVSIDVLLTWGTRNFASVAVLHSPRELGRSSYTYRKLFHHAMDLITGFSTLPLRIATMIGFAAAAFGLIVFIFVCGAYLVHGTSVPGFPFLASIIAIFAGAQLCALGMIGEYLARMHLRSMGVPSSVIRELVGFIQ